MSVTIEGERMLGKAEASPVLPAPGEEHPSWVPYGEDHAVRPVVIVGGGLAGLTLAVSLAQQQIPTLLLEAGVRVSEGSRAIVFTRRTLEILAQVGVAPRIVEKGLPWTTGHSFYRGRPVFRLQVPEDPQARHGPLTNLQQPLVEQALLEMACTLPALEIRWGNRVRAVVNDGAHVALTVETPGGDYSLRAQWVVAADGAKSTLRSLLGLRMEGASYEGHFVIADIRIALPLPTERLAFFEPAWNPGNTVLMHRQPDDLWRIDYQLPAGADPEAALAPEALQAGIAAQLASIGQGHLPWSLVWSSVYSARTLTLPEYVHGRVIFVGDAAHLLPIFGVRGANTAFQDAQALAWRLAAVARGCAPMSLLASYSAERLAVAREIIDEAGRSTRFMTPPTGGHRVLRDAALALALHEECVKPLLHWRTARVHRYGESPLNTPIGPQDSASVQSLLPGDCVPDACLGADDFLLDHFGHHFTLLIFTDALEPEFSAACDAVRATGVDLHVLKVNRTVGDDGGTLTDPDGVLAAQLEAHAPETCLLIRPDQHLCARWTGQDAGRLSAALARALSRETPGASSPRREVPDTASPLEATYDALAAALDSVDEGERLAMMVKLALLAADTVGDADRFSGLLTRARTAR